ncbi:hypothetical protein TWF506_006442 [Arthrobotrys conoides]|uniref:Uncharacterized protein n=1 Tax=Arthrobotrys conoides TaxID=74498 RepID=A0AAN8N9A2_9PEZI
MAGTGLIRHGQRNPMQKSPHQESPFKPSYQNLFSPRSFLSEDIPAFAIDKPTTSTESFCKMEFEYSGFRSPSLPDFELMEEDLQKERLLEKELLEEDFLDEDFLDEDSPDEDCLDEDYLDGEPLGEEEFLREELLEKGLLEEESSEEEFSEEDSLDEEIMEEEEEHLKEDFAKEKLPGKEKPLKGKLPEEELLSEEPPPLENTSRGPAIASPVLQETEEVLAWTAYDQPPVRRMAQISDYQKVLLSLPEYPPMNGHEGTPNEALKEMICGLQLPRVREACLHILNNDLVSAKLVAYFPRSKCEAIRPTESNFLHAIICRLDGQFNQALFWYRRSHDTDLMVTAWPWCDDIRRSDHTSIARLIRRLRTELLKPRNEDRDYGWLMSARKALNYEWRVFMEWCITNYPEPNPGLPREPTPPPPSTPMPKIPRTQEEYKQYRRRVGID